MGRPRAPWRPELHYDGRVENGCGWSVAQTAGCGWGCGRLFRTCVRGSDAAQHSAGLHQQRRRPRGDLQGTVKSHAHAEPSEEGCGGL